MPKRILVAGGAGFIGAHLCRYLLARGHDVTCADNFITGTEAGIEDLRAFTKFKLLRHDIETPLGGDYDEIYNLACPASPIHYQRDPVRTIFTSVMGTNNLLTLARDCGAKILQASTSEVYGDALVHPQSETYWGNINPTGPRACYSEGKRCAETLFFDHHRVHGTAVKVARIFNTYGPGMQMDDGRVVPSFVIHALTGKPLIVFGDGSHSRSFCHVDDMVDGLVRLMQSTDDFKGPVNLGNPQEISIFDLASRIVALSGSASKIEFHAATPEDPRRRCPDIGLACSELGWMPKTSLADGLKETIADVERRLHASRTPERLRQSAL